MSKRLPRRPSPALVVAVVAVLLTSAGSATAARLITGKQIKNSSITSTDIKNGSLQRGDFRSSQLPAGPRGAQGPAGANGAPGPPGGNGTNGFGLIRYLQTANPFSDGESDIVVTVCPAGTFATGGAAWAADTATGATDHPEVITSDGIAYSDAGIGVGYFAGVSNVASGAVDVIVDAVCANASQVSSSVRGKARRARR